MHPAAPGRYPKRRLTAQWRALCALLLGVPSLKLLDVDSEPLSEAERKVHRKVNDGSATNLFY